MIYLTETGLPEFVPIRSLRPSPTQWETDPIQVMRLTREKDEQGAPLRAIIRSYPMQGTASLSAADVAGAMFDGKVVHPGVVQIVIALGHEIPDIRAYRIHDGGTVVEEPLELRGTASLSEVLERWAAGHQREPKAQSPAAPGSYWHSPDLRLSPGTIWWLRVQMGLLALTYLILFNLISGAPALLLSWLANRNDGAIQVVLFIVASPFAVLWAALMLWWLTRPFRAALAPWGGLAVIGTIAVSLLLIPIALWWFSDWLYSRDAWFIGAPVRIAAWLWFGVNLISAWRWLRTGYPEM